MPAPRANPDDGSRERLLKAGLQVARRQGIQRLTVRAVASLAQANLGTFVYHFGTREAFCGELIERWYAPLWRQLTLTGEAPLDALSALRRALLAMVRWLIRHRSFIAHLVLDAGAGEPAARSFLKSLDQRHPALLLQLIQRAQHEGSLRRGDAMHQLLFLMSTLAAPLLLFHLLGQPGLAPQQLANSLRALSSDVAAVETRLDWALRGLAP